MKKALILFRFNILSIVIWSFLLVQLIKAQAAAGPASASRDVMPGAARFDQYIPPITGKSVAVFANQTSVIGTTHLVDVLLSKGITIKKIFSPEHGFRGVADAGEKVGNTLDSKTGIPLISLYGPKRKPSADNLKDVDIMIFDIQDVGARFYTYISSLQEYIESAIKPFELFGYPSLPHNLASFTPKSKEGATDPKLKDQLCYGWDVSGTPEEVLKQVDNKIQLKWVINAYKLFPEKNKFFLANNYFNKLAGNDILMQQIKDGKTEDEIRKSWQPKLDAFKRIRKKYLLYTDFE